MQGTKDGMADERKREWIRRWEHDNGSVRDGWIKRNDGRIGYCYLNDPNYVIRGDFMKRHGVYQRIWIPCFKAWQIHELQFSSDLETVMKDVEEFAQAAEEQNGRENQFQDAEII